jgi:hypothetical protein
MKSSNAHILWKFIPFLGGAGGVGRSKGCFDIILKKNLICLFIFLLHIDLFSYIVQCCILCTSIMFGSICYMHVLIFFCLLIFLETIILFCSLLFCTLIYFPSFNTYLSNIHFFSLICNSHPFEIVYSTFFTLFPLWWRHIYWFVQREEISQLCKIWPTIMAWIGYQIVDNS